MNLCASLLFWDVNFSSQLLSTALNAAQSSTASPSWYARSVALDFLLAQVTVMLSRKSQAAAALQSFQILWLSSQSSGPDVSLQIFVFRVVIDLQIQSSGTTRGL